MDPILYNIVIGIASNAIFSFLVELGVSVVPEEERLSIIQNALNDVEKDISSGLALLEESQYEKARIFLETPEVEGVFRQLFVTMLTDKSKDAKEIRREFALLWNKYVGMNNHTQSVTNTVFDALLKLVDAVFEKAIASNELFAHEAKSSYRYVSLLAEIRTVKERTNLLSAKDLPSIDQILDFERTYRQTVISRHGFIVPPFVDQARKIPADDIFVAPMFSKTRPAELNQQSSSEEFTNLTFRSVILGNPGGGKSTFLNKLAYDLASNFPERLLGGRLVTPIVVVLREYGAEKRSSKCSILQFIEAMINSRYQVEPPARAVEYLLSTGRVAILFDGLDELLNTSDRQEISSDVELFSQLYPSVPVIVTSRQVGYEQAPLDAKVFAVNYLVPYDEDQVSMYAQKWFALDSDQASETASATAYSFLSESRIVPDLRSNPLMLALMCNIYKGENYIPKNRPDLYEKCATWLFERWDKSRGIGVQLRIETLLRPALMFLASWIYNSPHLQSGVPERELIEQAAQYLSPKRFEDLDEAMVAAREFIEFCSGRAWVFTDAGTTKSGERLYQFTHRTFLEFFTACHLVRVRRSPEELGGFLLPKILNREWDVVSQLCFQIQSNHIEGAGDELLEMLLVNLSSHHQRKKENLLSFCLRSLEFLVPKRSLVSQIVEASLEACILMGLEVYSKREKGEDAPSADTVLEPTLLTDFSGVSDENIEFVVQVAERYLQAELDSRGEKTVVVADILLNLQDYFNPKVVENRISRRWNEMTSKLWRENERQLKACCKKNLFLCPPAWFRRLLTLNELFEFHGHKALFGTFNVLFGNFHYFPVATIIALNYLCGDLSKDVNVVGDQLRRDLKEFGLLFLQNIRLSEFQPSVELSLVANISGETYSNWLERNPGVNPNWREYSEEELFGAFAVLAVQLPTYEDMGSSLVSALSANQNPRWLVFKEIFLAKARRSSKKNADKRILDLKFAEQRTAAIRNWLL